MGPNKYGDFYLQVETYPYGMVPRKCVKYTDSGTGSDYFAPNIAYQVQSNGATVWDQNYPSYQTKSFLRKFSEYSANQSFKAVLSTIDFRNGATNANVDYPVIAMDYTVSVYHD